MPHGTITKLVHLSDQRRLENAQLVREHNDTGFGTLLAADGTDVYFSYEAADGCPFDALWVGQEVEFHTLEGAPNKAASLTPLHHDAHLNKSGLRIPD